MSAVACPECAGYHTSRAYRRTFFQKVILFHLGYYPWKCIDCSSRFFSKDRGHRRRS
jgi:DNA-directed RNA polymerase subunit RPC12/RpoP